MVNDILEQVRTTRNPMQLAEIIKVAQQQMEEATRVDHLARIQEQFGSDLERYQQLRGELADVQQRLVAGVKAYADENQVAASFDPIQGGFVIGAVSDNDKVGKRKPPLNYAAIAQGFPAHMDSLRLRLEIDSSAIPQN